MEDVVCMYCMCCVQDPCLTDFVALFAVCCSCAQQRRALGQPCGWGSQQRGCPLSARHPWPRSAVRCGWQQLRAVKVFLYIQRFYPCVGMCSSTLKHKHIISLVIAVILLFHPLLVQLPVPAPPRQRWLRQRRWFGQRPAG